MPSSTIYDTLNPNRFRMPPLEVVRAIVIACGADVEQWTGAWQKLRMQEHVNTPAPCRVVNPPRFEPMEITEVRLRTMAAQPRYLHPDRGRQQLRGGYGA